MTADTENEEKELSVLLAASRAAGLDARGAELIRRGENVLWRLPGKIVARIARPAKLTLRQRKWRSPDGSQGTVSLQYGRFLIYASPSWSTGNL